MKKTALQMILESAKKSSMSCYQDSSYKIYVRDAVGK